MGTSHRLVDTEIQFHIHRPPKRSRAEMSAPPAASVHLPAQTGQVYLEQDEALSDRLARLQVAGLDIELIAEDIRDAMVRSKIQCKIQKLLLSLLPTS